MNIDDIKINLEELENRKKQNFEERLKFVKMYADWMKSVPNSVWSSQQNVLINSQLKTATKNKELYLKVNEKSKNTHK